MSAGTDAVTSGWRVIGATARGAMHVKVGLPNQDCHAHAEVTDQGDGIVLAVADGHGERRAVRAEIGARLAVTVATEHARAFVEHHRPGPTADQVASELVPQIVEAWRAAVRRHAAEHPLRTSERALVDPQARPDLQYGCTLLVAAVIDATLVLAQIGDGDILVVTESGATTHPVPTSTTLVGGETLSLAAADAEAVAISRVAALDPSTRLVMLATDGYANSFEASDWERSIGADYARLLSEHGVDWMAAQLPEWVEASARAAGDDVTVLLATRSPDGTR